MDKQITDFVAAAQHVVVVQADNPDADSLGSALALEHILSDLGKQVSLFCGVDIPTYLRYLEGWDRVQKDLPKVFDAAIIVDASTYSLFEQLAKTGQLAWLKSRPTMVLDHHKTVEKPLDFAAVSLLLPEAASTGEMIYNVAKEQNWTITSAAAEHLMTSILGDTQGLTNSLASADTYRVMADLIDAGADRPKLEDARREASKMAEVIYRYKGRLIGRTQFADEGRIAYVVVPQDEINSYSPLYNPAALVQFDMLQTQGVVLSIVFKTYDDDHITGAIRSSLPVAGKLAEQLGGGGHDFASGFKQIHVADTAAAVDSAIALAAQLLQEAAA